MTNKLFTIALLIFGLATSAHAGSVDATFTEVAEGQWELTATLTPAGGNVTGLATFSFNILDTPADGVSFDFGNIFGIDPDEFVANGFSSRSQGAVGGAGSTRYSVGAVQDPGAQELNVPGIGVSPVVIDGPGPNDFDLGVPALLGVLSTQPGLTAANFQDLQFGALTTGGGQNTVISPDNITLTISPIPEPTTMALAGLALVGFVARRRRS